jgi:hypothetical protein
VAFANLVQSENMHGKKHATSRLVLACLTNAKLGVRARTTQHMSVQPGTVKGPTPSTLIKRTKKKNVKRGKN